MFLLIYYLSNRFWLLPIIIIIVIDVRKPWICFAVFLLIFLLSFKHNAISNEGVTCVFGLY